MLDLPVPGHCGGDSLLPLLRRKEPPVGAEKAAVVVEWHGWMELPLERMRLLAAAQGTGLLAPEARSIRSRRWKLNLHACGEHELYDLATDPEELHNAIQDRDKQAVVQSLREQLADWQEEQGDPLPLPPLQGD